MVKVSNFHKQEFLTFQNHHDHDAVIDFITLKNFINLYYSASKNSSNQIIKKIPVEQIEAIMNLEGFRNARNSGESLSDYVVNVQLKNEE